MTCPSRRSTSATSATRRSWGRWVLRSFAPLPQLRPAARAPPAVATLRSAAAAASPVGGAPPWRPPCLLRLCFAVCCYFCCHAACGLLAQGVSLLSSLCWRLPAGFGDLHLAHLQEGPAGIGSTVGGSKHASRAISVITQPQPDSVQTPLFRWPPLFIAACLLLLVTTHPGAYRLLACRPCRSPSPSSARC